MSYGIYCITNLENNKKYIGQTNEGFEKRKKRHQYLLKNNIHFNPHLQNAFNKYGENKFKFNILERFDNKYDLDDLEKYYIRLNESDNPNYGYNLESGGKKNKIISDESKKKMSESQSKRRKSSSYTNKSGYYRVCKIKCKNCFQGFQWAYVYKNEEGKMIWITSIDIGKLEKKVKSKNLEWIKYENLGKNEDMSYYEDISELLEKYSTKQSGERWLPETERKRRGIENLHEKLRLFSGINGEFFRLSGSQIDRAKHMIKELNFNKICPRCSNEQMIVLICYYVKCEYDAKYNRKNCKRVFDEYNISSNLVDRFMFYLARRGIEGTILDKKFV